LPDPVPPAHLQPTQERDLLDRLRGGEEEAFASIFRAHYAHLVSAAEAILRERAPAEDVAQDVLLNLWQQREKIVLETSLRPYLFRAVRNRALNQIRHRRIAERSDPVAFPSRTAPPADRAFMEKELDVALHDAVGKLPERCREVFELSRVHGLKYAEIAQVLDISIKTVETQMGRAIRTLRERLAPWLPDGGGL